MHLVNLIPPAASLLVPSVSLVHEILVRANLPRDTIALAVCILDSLSSKFSLNWRLLCPLANPLADVSNKRHTISASNPSAQQFHIDCVNPEVIILAALVIAIKFTSDRHEQTQYYRAAWGDNLWTNDQINATERCIMENLGYRILPLCHPRLIADAVDDMERAGRQLALPSHTSSVTHHARSVSTTAVPSTGKAVFGLGMQLTPVETPASEEPPRHTAHVSLAPANVAASGGGMMALFPGSSLVRESLHLPASLLAKRNQSFTYGSD